jgi:hypothetical protein
MKNKEIMNYIEYHNTHADAYARHMFDRDYADITWVAQGIVDNRILDAWERIPFIERKNLQK